MDGRVREEKGRMKFSPSSFLFGFNKTFSTAYSFMQLNFSVILFLYFFKLNVTVTNRPTTWDTSTGSSKSNEQGVQSSQYPNLTD